MDGNIALTLFLFLLTVNQSSAEREVINIFEQNNGIDILQLRNKENKMFNAFYKDSALKWNLRDSDGNYVIPYTFYARYDPEEMSSFREAINRIEANTCIRFKERTDEHDYIEIQNQVGEGCYTNVGRIGGKGILMLESNYRRTCMKPEVVIHELMHVVGLWHEHQRYDRDRYIKVHYENINKDYWIQFKKVSPFQSTTYKVPYDYKSVMHYSKTAFALDGRISMETLNPRFQDVIGKQKDASPSDYKKICEIYQCKKCMGKTTDTDNESEETETAGSTPNTVPDSCQDLNPIFCKTLAALHLLDCSYFYRQQCCATCASLGFRPPNNSPFDSFIGALGF